MFQVKRLETKPKHIVCIVCGQVEEPMLVLIRLYVMSMSSSIPSAGKTILARDMNTQDEVLMELFFITLHSILINMDYEAQIKAKKLFEHRFHTQSLRFNSN